MLRVRRKIGREQAEVRPEFGDVAQRFPVGGTEIQQGGSLRRARDKARPGIKPGSLAEFRPIHRVYTLTAPSLTFPKLKPRKTTCSSAAMKLSWGPEGCKGGEVGLLAAWSHDFARKNACVWRAR